MGKKLFFVLLGLIALAYMLTLAVGFAFDGRGGTGHKRGWLDAMDGVLSPLAPPLDTRSLECNDQPVGRVFRLHETADACTLAIPSSSDEDYRKAELRLLKSKSGPPAALYVRARYSEEDFPQRERDRTRCKLDEEPLESFRLEVEYLPADADDPDWECWLHSPDSSEPLSLVVMEDGGRLELRCRGCDEAARRSIRLVID